MFAAILVELVIAKVMKINDMKVIAIVNILTQFLLYTLIYMVSFLITPSLTIIEIIRYTFDNVVLIFVTLIILIEFAIYKLKIKNQSTKKIFLYSLLANLASFGVSYIIMIIAY